MSREALAFPPAHAPRTLWVFLLDVPREDVRLWEAPTMDDHWPLPAALGVSGLDPDHVEVFPEDRIAEYGMPRYLTEALGMDEAQVALDLQTLESLTGVIVIVHARALAGRDGAFDPSHPARFVGRYSEETGLTAAQVAPPRPSATGEILGGPAPAPQFPRRIMTWALAILLLVVVIVWSLA